MKKCLIPLLALTASVGATGAANDTPLPASAPAGSPSSRNVRTEAATSRTDGFLKLLRDQLDIKPMVSKLIDWDRLRQEAGKTTEPAVKTERLAYVECWKRLAEAHDFGTMCSRPNVFEWKAGALLAGKHKADNRLPYADLGLPMDAACEYLLAEELPTWAQSLRLCAAGVLAGDGNRRGMDVLLEALRAVPAECQVPWWAGVSALGGNAEAPPKTFPGTCDDKCGQIVLTVTTLVVIY